MSRLVELYFKEFIRIKADPDLESDVYNNVLSIESCVTNMKELDLVTELELQVLDGIIMGYNFSELAKLLGVNRHTLSDTFRSVCTRISFILGSNFSDLSVLSLSGFGELELDILENLAIEELYS